VKDQPSRLTWQLAIALLTTTLPMLVGCGNDGASRSGKVTLDDAPVSLKPNQVMKIAFQPQDEERVIGMSNEERASLIVSVRTDGSFNLPNALDGSYWVTVSDFERYPSGDRLANHFRKEPHGLKVELIGTESMIVNLKKEWSESSNSPRK